VPLALVVFAPVMLNILLFHVFIQFAATETALISAVFYGHLVYLHRHRYATLVAP
jgi:hypothetical protein